MRRTIIVPVDGATNCKLEVLDYETFATCERQVIETPVSVNEGLAWNRTRDECDWFLDAIRELPAELKACAVIAPVARGASGGLIGEDGGLIESPGKGLTLSYTQEYPRPVEAAFRELAPDSGAFFRETGSVRDFPGSLTLLKRFIFEEMERPALLEKARGFAIYPLLISGRFLGEGGYLDVVHRGGNEHSYWMCHSGTRDIRAFPGTFSSYARKCPSFMRLVPERPSVCYTPLGETPESVMRDLGLSVPAVVTSGGHDTSLSHLPVAASYRQLTGGDSVVHVEAGSWTMLSRIGGAPVLPVDGCRRDIIVQGTVDGEPVITARYGGGNDLAHVRRMCRDRGCDWEPSDPSEETLESVLADRSCMVLPGISPVNHGSGPFPECSGEIVDEERFFGDPAACCIRTNLMTSIATSVQLDAVAGNERLPVILTAGGASDPVFGRLIATLSGMDVYTLRDGDGNAVTETTTLGAAMAGRSAVAGRHPAAVDISPLGMACRKVEPYGGRVPHLLAAYRETMMERIRNSTG